MKALERHLYSRNGHLYYRSAIPQDLRAFLPVKEVVVSLRIKDRTEARILVAQINHAEQQILERLQQQLLSPIPNMPSEGIIQAAIESLESLKGRLPHKSPLKFQAIPESKNRLQKASPLLSEIVQKYMADCIEDAHKTVVQKQSTFDLFQDLEGDVVFSEIGIEQAQAFKGALLKMPAHAKKRIGARSLKNISRDEIEGAESLHYKTINGRLGNMRTLFNWAERNGFYEGKNPFSGLAVKGHKTSGNKRSSFKSEEIKILFGSPLYIGCKGEKWALRFEGGNQVIKDALYWVPLIGIYSGMRLNEICQLEVTDIRREEEIWVFDINDSGSKSLKTVSSARIIPIHSKLIEAGIIEYWRALKNQNEIRLFPDLREGVNDSLSAPFSKRFRRLLNTLGLTREGICFHSLRHTFIDGLRKVGVERSIAMALTGHQSSDVHDQYGNGYSMEIMQIGLNRLTFPISLKKC